MNVLTPEKDPMGAAILEYAQRGNTKKQLKVLSSMFEDDVMDVAHLFRDRSLMPAIEQEALLLAHGRTLDVGAGAGCHALELQRMGLDVTAIDISPFSCQAMKMRGINKVECINLFDQRLAGKYHTILLLMNGTGIAGKLCHLPRLLIRLKELMEEGGQILVDSSDLRYVYEDEDGNMDWDPADGYYGEVDYQMVYDGVKGESFDWLYVDFPLLKTIAGQNGLKAELISEGTHYDYLARLT